MSEQSCADQVFMAEAIRLARRAGGLGEVPVGAVVSRDGAILGRGYNRREQTSDPTHHAEIAALRMAAKRLKTWRLDRCTLYATLEPCAMCAGACVNARIGRIVFGCADPKGGYVATLGAIASDRRLNHRCRVVGGVRGAECAELLTGFFRTRRGRGNLHQF